MKEIIDGKVNQPEFNLDYVVDFKLKSLMGQANKQWKTLWKVFND